MNEWCLKWRESNLSEEKLSIHPWKHLHSFIEVAKCYPKEKHSWRREWRNGRCFHGWIERKLLSLPHPINPPPKSPPRTPSQLPFPQENTLVWEPPLQLKTLFSAIKLVPRTTCAGLDRKPKSKWVGYMDGSLTSGFQRIEELGLPPSLISNLQNSKNQPRTASWFFSSSFMKNPVLLVPWSFSKTQ